MYVSTIEILVNSPWRGDMWTFLQPLSTSVWILAFSSTVIAALVIAALDLTYHHTQRSNYVQAWER